MSIKTFFWVNYSLDCANILTTAPKMLDRVSSQKYYPTLDPKNICFVWYPKSVFYCSFLSFYQMEKRAESSKQSGKINSLLNNFNKQKKVFRPMLQECQAYEGIKKVEFTKR